MSAGEDIAAAHRAAAKACYYLVTLIVKKRGNREYLETALALLEEAALTIRTLLTAPSAGPRVRVPTSGESDDDRSTD